MNDAPPVINSTTTTTTTTTFTNNTLQQGNIIPPKTEIYNNFRALYISSKDEFIEYIQDPQHVSELVGIFKLMFDELELLEDKYVHYLLSYILIQL